MTELFSEWFKPAVMSPLAVTVKRMGICPNCHKKTLERKYSGEYYIADQCAKCGHVYMGAHDYLDIEQPPTPCTRAPAMTDFTPADAARFRERQREVNNAQWLDDDPIDLDDYTRRQWVNRNHAIGFVVGFSTCLLLMTLASMY